VSWPFQRRISDVSVRLRRLDASAAAERTITMRSKATRAGALAAPLLLASLLAGLGPAPASAATADCRSLTGAQPPSPGNDGLLNGVAVLSACNAWAVGDFGGDDVQDTLIEHWDGANWTVIPSPDPGAVHNVLTSVRAASPTNIWAAGFYDDGDNSLQQTLILHWNGAHWTQQQTPSPGSDGATLSDVRPVSGSEAWAVGLSDDGNTDKPLILHRIGGHWQQAMGVPRTEFGEALSGVAATSATDVWAVGDGFGGPVTASAARAALVSRGARAVRAAGPDLVSIILHWNGTKWSQLKSPNPGTENLLNAVGARSRTSALAVGTTKAADGSFHTLAARWNGKTWTTVPSDSPGLSGPMTSDFLTGITMTSPANAWAVGDMDNAGSLHALLEHWNGSRWTTVQGAGPDGVSELIGVAASSASSAWAVGDSGRQPFALHCC
jgi:hypothetical protein